MTKPKYTIGTEILGKEIMGTISSAIYAKDQWWYVIKNVAMYDKSQDIFKSTDSIISEEDILAYLSSNVWKDVKGDTRVRRKNTNKDRS
jgi:hypothetical protein